MVGADTSPRAAQGRSPEKRAIRGVLAEPSLGDTRAGICYTQGSRRAAAGRQTSKLKSDAPCRSFPSRPARTAHPSGRTRGKITARNNRVRPTIDAPGPSVACCRHRGAEGMLLSEDRVRREESYISHSGLNILESGFRECCHWVRECPIHRRV